jgi:hypothetical protein
LTNAWGALRRRILTPSFTETKLATRGFHEKSPAAKELLETVGESFLTGYACAAEARSPVAAEERLEEIPPQFRGFAYEGAAMAFTVRDRLPIGRSGNFARFLAGRGDAHIYMAYVGVGWGMARLPRFRWPSLHTTDPLLRWLALDGYGFHQAYFHTDRYIYEQFRNTRVWWPAEPQWYAARAIDQGIGRALWFVGGTDVDLVATMIDKFPAQRRADLYSGAGLAATYAGGADEEELRMFWRRAGDYRPHVAQGSAFAAEARIRAGLVVPHTGVATSVFCGMTPEQAAQVTHELRPETAARPGQTDHSEHSELRESAPPAFEVWRQRIAEKFASIGGVGT